MRCLILIALSLVLANARQDFNKLRFGRLLRSYQDNMDNEYQSGGRRHFGGLHDVIGRGIYYPVQGDEESCGPDNWQQCINDEQETEPWTRQQWGGQCDGEECEYEQEQNQFTNNPFGRQCYGEECQDEQDQYPTGRRGQYQQNQYNQFQDQDEEFMGGEYENEFEQQGYGNQFQQQQQQMRGGQCTPNPRMLPKLEKITCKLATTLYKQARRERDDKNTVVSPAAVLLGLGALSVGAKTHTKKDVCQITGECPTINGLSALARLLKKGGQSTRRHGIQGNQGMQQGWMGQQEEMDEEYGQQCVGRQCTQIKPITGIFLSKQTPAQQSFLQLVQGCLGVKVQKCDFQRHPQQCRQQINQWVSTKTQHKMPRLVQQDSITDNTKMVVVSGLELKAQWGQQFKNHQTKKGIFHPLDTQKVKRVPFMHKRGIFNYHETELVKVVGIPTQGKELTMYVVLPKCKTCLTKVEREELNEGDELRRLLDNCDQKKRQVNVQLPKFEIKHKLDAKQALLKKGLVNMFEQSRADFSGITGVRGGVQFEENEITNKRTQIHVNKFLHQATIKVTSTGIKAAGPQDQYQDQYEPEEYMSQQMRGQYGQQFGQYEDEEDINGEETYMTGRDRYEQIMGMNRFGQGQQGTKKQFKANHPFVFVIRHNPTKQVLLMGRVIDAGQKTTTSTTEGSQMEELYPSQGIY